MCIVFFKNFSFFLVCFKAISVSGGSGEYSVLSLLISIYLQVDHNFV